MQKTKLLLFVLLIAGSLHAQDTTRFHFGFNHMALSVKDVDKAAEFYKNVLKLPEITNRSKLEGVRWFSLADGRELHLIAILKDQPVTTNKAIHLAFTITNLQFDGFVARLDKMRVPYSDWPGADRKVNIRADGIKQIFFQDTDGYWLEVNSIGEK